MAITGGTFAISALRFVEIQGVTRSWRGGGGTWQIILRINIFISTISIAKVGAQLLAFVDYGNGEDTYHLENTTRILH